MISDAKVFVHPKGPIQTFRDALDEIKKLDKMPCHITDEHVYNPWDDEKSPWVRLNEDNELALDEADSRHGEEE